LDDDKDGSPSRKMTRSESSSTVAADEDHEINGTSSRAPNGKVAGAAVGQPSGSNKDLQLRVGRGTGVFRQAFVLFRKRLTILRRNWIPYFFIVIIPILAAALTTLLLDGFEAISCSPGAQSSNPGSFSISNLRNLRMPVGPSSAVSAEALAALAQGLGLPFANASSFQIVDTVEQFNQFIVDNYKTTWPGGFFIPEGSNPLFAYVGNWQLYTPTLTQNFMDIFLSGTPIVTQYQEFASPFAPGAGSTLQLVLYFGLAMCAYPGFFALYPTVERIRNVRALHYSNGIRAAPLWLAYTVFDFCFVIVISAVITGLWVGVSLSFQLPALRC